MCTNNYIRLQTCMERFLSPLREKLQLSLTIFFSLARKGFNKAKGSDKNIVFAKEIPLD